MDSASDAPDDVPQDDVPHDSVSRDDVSGAKQPAPVVKASAKRTRSSSRSSPKKAAPKKAAAKKTPAKKTPAKKKATDTGPVKKAAVKKAAVKEKTPAKKAAAKRAPAVTSPKKASAKATAAEKKAPAKKAAAKSAPAKKSPSKAPAAKHEPVQQSPAQKSSPSAQPAPPRRTQPAPPRRTEPERPLRAAGSTRLTQPPPTREQQPKATRPTTFAGDRMAMIVSVTEEMVNELLPFLIGHGVEIEPLDTTVALPGMGELEVRIGLTVTSVRAVLDPAHRGRLKVVVSADGEVATRTVGFVGESLRSAVESASVVGGDAAVERDSDDQGRGSGIGSTVQMPSAPIPVVGEALVQPFMYLNADGRIAVGLDLSTAELVSIGTDQTAPTPDGVEAAAWPGVVAMFGVLLGGVGGELFAALSEHVGEAALEIDEELGSVFVELGGKPGPLAISVSSGLLTIGLPAQSSVKGKALPVPIAGKRVGIGLASSVVDTVAHQALFRAAGELPLPFELEVSVDEQSVGGRFKNTRLFPESFPDLRAALRTEVRTRLLRGQLELSVQSAWLEMPSILPSFVNQFSKRLGGLVGLAPFRVKFPAVVPIPLPDERTLDLKLDDLRVTVDGIGLVASRT